MDNKKGFFQWFKQTFFKDEKSNKKLSKYQYVLVVLLLGVVFMIVSNFFSQSQNTQTTNALPVLSGEKPTTPVFKSKSSNDTEAAIKAYETQYENQLKDALENVIGVGDVTVVVNVDATAIKVLEKNENTQSQVTNETDTNGGKRTVDDQSQNQEVVIVRNGEEEKPIVLTIKKPPIRGVLIVAKGAENIQIKQWIIEAVTRLLDVPSHRVSVLPKKIKGE